MSNHSSYNVATSKANISIAQSYHFHNRIQSNIEEAVSLIGDAIDIQSPNDRKMLYFPHLHKILMSAASGITSSTFDSRLVNEGMKTFQVH